MIIRSPAVQGTAVGQKEGPAGAGCAVQRAVEEDGGAVCVARRVFPVQHKHRDMGLFPGIRSADFIRDGHDVSRSSGFFVFRDCDDKIYFARLFDTM